MCEPTLTARKRWQREAATEMALLDMEEAAVNNGLTVAAGGGGAYVASLHLPYGVRVFFNQNKTARGERRWRTAPKL